MEHLTFEDFRVVWETMARRYAWQLVQDETGFFQAVRAEFAALNDQQQSDRRRLRIAIWRSYSVLLYRALYWRQEQAAQELWIAAMRLSLKRGFAPDDAKVLAQEVVCRLLEELPKLADRPQILLSHAIWTCRSLWREYWRQGGKMQSLMRAAADEAEETEYEPADSADVATEVEQRLMDAEIRQILEASLKNALERQVLLHIVLLGEKPRDVARDQGVPLHRARLAKSRALKRLRADPQTLQSIYKLTGQLRPPPATRGDSSDDK